jgi:hypothetical protein
MQMLLPLTETSSPAILLNREMCGCNQPHASLIGGGPRSSSGNSAKFTANRRASSRVSRFGRRAMQRCDSSGIGGKTEVRGLRPKRR